jgi:CDP-glucose 4,6-dehydratase
MRAVLAGEPARIRNPTAVRPWQHVLNPLSGYLRLAQALWERPELARAWNFGPSDDDARPVSWIVEQLSGRWPSGVRWGSDAGASPHEAHHLKLDSSLARAHLGWRPSWDLARGLDAVADWYLGYAARRDVLELTLGQIAEFPT